MQTSNTEFACGVHYSSYALYQDDEAHNSQWGIGGEIALRDVLPHIGLKLRGNRLTYDMPLDSGEGMFIREYIPLSFCTSFDILPFIKMEWLRLSVETGFGLYFWQAWMYHPEGYDTHLEVPLVEPEEKANERDFGFVGGLTLQVRPYRNIAVEYATRYNYIFSSNLEKYGFFDKDEKIWENGVGVKFIMPL
jgi:hypothetical protein